MINDPSDPRHKHVKHIRFCWLESIFGDIEKISFDFRAWEHQRQSYVILYIIARNETA